jgi:hypothetical protein
MTNHTLKNGTITYKNEKLFEVIKRRSSKIFNEDINDIIRLPSGHDRSKQVIEQLRSTLCNFGDTFTNVRIKKSTHLYRSSMDDLSQL